MVVRCATGLTLCVLLLASCGSPVGQAAGAALPVPEAVAPGGVLLGQDQVELITDGAVGAARLGGAMSAARATIDAEIYEFDRPELRNAMLAAHARGVRVRVISDPTVGGNATTLGALRSAGIPVVLFPDGPMQIDHVKLLVVDGRLALFGGMNWGARSYLNHDFDVEVKGPAVNTLESVFAADLTRSGSPAEQHSPGDVEGAGLSLLTSYPDDQVSPAVLSLVDASRRYIFIEMFVLTDPQVTRALQAAAARGVKVFVLFDPSQTLNQRAMVVLRSSGVEARFYRSSGERLHAKAMVVDGTELLVGSANWTRSGFTRNHELDALISSSALASQALVRMESDWVASA